MKSEADIRRVHDLLGNLVNGDVPVRASQQTTDDMRSVFATLCWILQCDNPQAKALDRFVRDIHQEVRDAGYALPHAPAPSGN